MSTPRTDVCLHEELILCFQMFVNNNYFDLHIRLFVDLFIFVKLEGMKNTLEVLNMCPIK